MNKSSRITKVILSFIVAIFLTIVGGQKVLAAHPSQVGPISVGETVGDKTFFPIKSAGNYKAFCTSGINTDIPLSRTCDLVTNGQWNEPTQAGVATIINEYKNNKINGTYNSYWYTEIAINSYINPGSMIVRAENAEEDSLVKSLVAKAKEAEKKASANLSISFSANTLTFTKDGNNYVSNTITVKDANGYLDSFDVSVSGTNGVKVINKTNNSFQVSFPASNVGLGQTVTVKATVTGKKSYQIAKNYNCGSGVQNVTIDYLETKTVTANGEITGKVTRNSTNVEISKVDITNGKEIKGATLIIKDANGKVVDEWVSETTPHKIVNKLEAGTYTLTETIAPKGYKKSTKEVTFEVKEDGKPVQVKFENEPIKTGVKLSKVDITNQKEIKGATLLITNEKTNSVVRSWVSTGKTEFIELEPGNYILSETIAPKGYKKSTKTVKFTVKDDGTVDTVKFENEPIKTGVKLSKVDITNQKEIKGATLLITNEKTNSVVRSWVSTGKTEFIELEPGNYILSETIAPKGYKKSTKTVKFTVKDDGTVDTVKFENEPIKTGVKLNKVDITDGKEIAGATLEITNAKTKKVVKTWVSTGKTEFIELEPGNYILSETIAPKGYKKSTKTVKFTVKEDGTVDTVKFENEPIKTGVKLSKVDITDGKEIAGATLEITNAKTKKVVKTWVSTGETEFIELEPGNYILSETIAPKGYKKSTKTVKFTVKDDGTVDTVKFENEPNKTGAKISKQDITDKKELPGATLVVKNEQGEEVAKWISTDKPHYIELQPGKYTLSETIAPVGYKLATETIEFEVRDDGTTTKVVMFNEPNKTGVKISKQDITSKQELPGATLIVKNEQGEEVAKWVSTDKPVYIELQPGNYTLTEVTAPEGYDLSYEVIKFTVNENGEATSDVIMYNSKTPQTADKNILLTVFGLIGTTIIGAVAIRKIKHQM